MSTTQTTTQPQTLVLVEPNQATLLDKLTKLELDMNANLVERQTVVRLLLCAVVAEQHCILLGDPGTGKSTAINRLASRIDGGGSVFKKLLSKDTDTGEIFGPLSIPGLMAEEQRRSLKYGAQKGATFWFLDEIWKSNSALLNALLTALEEREYDNDGKRIALDLLSCFGASNEPPQDDSLRALRDRFALCTYVEYVSDRGFIELSRMKLARQPDAINATLTMDELRALHVLRRQVVIPDHIVQSLSDLRRELKMSAVVVSDRRMLAAYETMAAHALLCGRLEVKESDMAILKHVLWSQAHEREAVAKAIDAINSRDRLAESQSAQMQSAYAQAYSAWNQAGDDSKTDIVIGLVKQLKKATKELVELLTDARADGQDATVIARCKGSVEQLLAEAQKLL